MSNSFKYVKAKGIATEDEYPYTARVQKCQKDGGSFKISGSTDIKGCDNLANALQKGPISIAVDAMSWQQYNSGVFSSCKYTSLNFAALLVGIQNGNWVIKNDWGVNWGESGYIRLTSGNTCGICDMATIPIK